MVIFPTHAAALNVLVVKGLGLGLEMVRLNGRRVAGPLLGKMSGDNFAPTLDRIGISPPGAVYPGRFAVVGPVGRCDWPGGRGGPGRWERRAGRWPAQTLSGKACAAGGRSTNTGRLH